MEYKIASGTSIQSLTTLVNALLLLGWVPQGGVSIAMDQGYSEYVQALVKS